MGDHPGPIDDAMRGARDLAVLGEPEQLQLMADLAGGDPAAGVRAAERRGPGRRPGSLNSRNAKFRDQILAMGPHPALALQRAYSTPVGLLAAQLGCTRLEAAQLAIRAAAELLPYIEGKQPVTVDLRERHDVVLIMAGAPGVGDDQLREIAATIDSDGIDAIDWSRSEFDEESGSTG